MSLHPPVVSSTNGPNPRPHPPCLCSLWYKSSSILWFWILRNFLLPADTRIWLRERKEPYVLYNRTPALLLKRLTKGGTWSFGPQKCTNRKFSGSLGIGGITTNCLPTQRRFSKASWIIYSQLPKIMVRSPSRNLTLCRYSIQLSPHSTFWPKFTKASKIHLGGLLWRA